MRKVYHTARLRAVALFQPAPPNLGDPDMLETGVQPQNNSRAPAAAASQDPEGAGLNAVGTPRSAVVDPMTARWEGVIRPYSAADVEHLRGSVRIEHTLADLGARRLWDLLKTEDYVAALGALTGNQAVQQVRAGLKAIYCSGWQVAADANTYGNTYPDQSLYPVDSVPRLVRRINQALQRADQIEHAEGAPARHWYAPIVADAEAGFGGSLNAFELMKAMIEAGASGVHFEDQLSSEKKCGHLGGKVLVPTNQFIRTLWPRGWPPTSWVCPPCWWREPTPTARGFSPRTSIPATASSSRAHVRRKASSASRGGSSAPSRGGWRTRPTPTSSGARRPLPISPRRGASPRRSMPDIRARCWRTTVRRRSIGGSTSTTRPSCASRFCSAPWGTSSSSSRSPASTR